MHEIAARAEQEGFLVHWGRKVLEVRPPVALDKGLGLTALLRSAAASDGAEIAVALSAGDDTNDIDAFDALQSLGRGMHHQAADMNFLMHFGFP